MLYNGPQNGETRSGVSLLFVSTKKAIISDFPASLTLLINQEILKACYYT